jgi:hypothetical protein
MMDDWICGVLENGYLFCGCQVFPHAPPLQYSNIPFPLGLTGQGELGRLCALFEFQWRLNNETYMAAFEN